MVSRSSVQAPDSVLAADFLAAALDGPTVDAQTRGLARHATVEADGARSYVLADADGDLLHVASYALD